MNNRYIFQLSLILIKCLRSSTVKILSFFKLNNLIHQNERNEKLLVLNEENGDELNCLLPPPLAQPNCGVVGYWFPVHQTHFISSSLHSLLICATEFLLWCCGVFIAFDSFPSSLFHIVISLISLQLIHN